jgi:cytochrome c556
MIVTRTGTVVLVSLALFAANGSPSAAVPSWTEARPEGDNEPRQPEPKPLKLMTRQEAMQLKLRSAQAILEGIALNDFNKIQAAADQMIQISNASDFIRAYQGKEYLFHVELMRRPSETISKKAKDNNIDGVMVAYNELTLSCLKCHQAMRDKKFDSRP